MADFFDIDFDGEYMLFGCEFEESSGIYIVYTQEKFLDLGATTNFKTAIEEHEHTRDWIKNAEGKEVLVAFHLDEDPESREDKLLYLQGRMQPLLKNY